MPVVVAGGIGLLPNEVYDRQLHPLVAGLRKRILKNLSRESEVLAAMQVRACLSSPSSKSDTGNRERSARRF